MPNSAPPNDTVRYFETAAGVASAAACVYAGLPFDVIKTRMQSSSIGLRHTALSVFRSSGLRGFYAGALPALASQVIENAALFTANGVVVRSACRFNGIPEERLVDHPGWYYACGGIAGFFSGTTICCVEKIKVLLQLQSVKLQQGQQLAVVYRGPVHCFSHILQTEGIRGLFRGMTALWLRDVPFNAFFLGGYELAASMIAKMSGQSSKDDLNPVQLMAAGSFAGASGWALAFPADVIKTRMQSTPGGAELSIRRAASLVYAEHGSRGFYRGVGAAVFRSIPANAAMFVAYEYCMRWLKNTSATVQYSKLQLSEYAQPLQEHLAQH
jgi:hypothetical protein